MQQNNISEEILNVIRDVPDFPKPGIIFKDITPLLSHLDVLNKLTTEMAKEVEKLGTPDCIVGIEARGFIFGVLLAKEMNIPFVPIRKPGKLPWKKIQEEYTLEYGTNTIEIHEDAILPGQKAIIVDDLLATGGTAEASAKLVKALKGEVLGFAFVIELAFLDGAKSLEPYAPIISMAKVS